ncbi:hypothetical protein KCU61_g532, partial [Aureobasidium melanogenum]
MQKLGAASNYWISGLKAAPASLTKFIAHLVVDFLRQVRVQVGWVSIDGHDFDSDGANEDSPTFKLSCRDEYNKCVRPAQPMQSKTKISTSSC